MELSKVNGNPIEPLFRKEVIKMDINRAERLLQKLTGYEVHIVSTFADFDSKINILI